VCCLAMEMCCASAHAIRSATVERTHYYLSFEMRSKNERRR